MNTFALVLIIPTLLTLGAAGTLFFSFKEKVDTSGRYFLLAEFLWLLTMAFVIAINTDETLATSLVFYIFTLCGLISEIAILFSIKALTQRVNTKKFIFWILILAVGCGFLEYLRHFVNPKLPLLFVSIFSLCITSITYIACKRTYRKGLEENLFIKWIAYTEIALTVVHLLRVSSFFSNTPVLTTNPTTIAIVIYSIWVSINLFRYISYQSLRISWVDPRASDGNALNRNLVRLVKEKNQFLQGLISSNRALGISALANSLAHQLSQPITGVILQTESVKRNLNELGGQESSIQILNTVTEQLNKLSALVNNLRKLFGTHELDFRSFSVQEACEEVLEVINPTLESKNILLSKIYESNPSAIGNPIQIQQVLINLFNNAIDAIENTKKGFREIHLKISRDKAFTVVAIQDNGPGVSTDIGSTMFDLYQSTKQNGLGIGLWLSKAIIDKHEGSITAFNNPQGGAVFEVRIPLASEINENK